MATINVYFSRDFTTLASQTELTLAPGDRSAEAVTVIGRVHYDAAAYVKYVSYLVPASAAEHDGVIFALLGRVDDFIAQLERGVGLTMGRSDTISDDAPMVDVRTLPFSGRIFVYIDDFLTEERAAAFLDTARPAGLKVEFRDARYVASRASHESPMAFISHDSRDKDDIARPLAVELSRMLCPVWYDEFQLRVGDSLRESIDKGLSVCPKCIVILSPSFCDGQGWSAAEFNAVMGKHINRGGNVILPVWHNVTRDQVAAFSPMVVDLFAVNTSVGIEEVARRINQVLASPPESAAHTSGSDTEMPAGD